MTGRLSFVAALSVSLAVHIGFPFVVPSDAAPKIEGSAESTTLRLGNGFVDVAMGSLAPAKPEGRAHMVESEVRTSAQEHRPASTSTPPQSQHRVNAVTASAPVAVSVSGLPLSPTSGAASVDKPATLAAPRTLLTSSDVSPVRPPPRADANVQGAPRRVSPGTGASERRGRENGQANGQANQSSTRDSPQHTAVGNAAVSNYPGLVMQKLSRTRRPSAGRRGSAIVGFEVAANGALAGTRILRSSGFGPVDRAALEHVSRAAPFPPPPEGAQRRFQVRYESRD